MKKIFMLAALLLCCTVAFGAQKPTYEFFVDNADTLRMDHYQAAKIEGGAPAVIFAFGGGFVGGHRDDARYVPMFEYLADNGVNVFSVDYRTELKNLTPADMSSFGAMAERVQRAVETACMDFFIATAYVAYQTEELNVNPAQIFACGSSAGAITAMQCEYELCNGTNPGFPKGFNYAGVIAFAGAIMSADGLSWDNKPCPMLLFHGDADSNVPFDKLTMGDAGLYGSLAISESLKELSVNHWFHRFNGADHSVAIDPMVRNKGEIYDFIQAVISGKVYDMNAVTTVRTGEYKTAFTIRDYIESNFK
ncbi:MAG: alpha/beta hydrolase [Muribaculaceae bacterium]